MKVYLVWARGTYCDYDVVNILPTEIEAEQFIKDEGEKWVDGYCNVTFSIEERELGIPEKFNF